MKKGFTLVEMMIVVAVIGVIAAIALPNLLRSRMEANENAAIENLRTICSAEISFGAAKERFASFAELISIMDGSGSAFLSTTWSEGIRKSGYAFYIPLVTVSNFECYADPVVLDKTGARYFRVDASGVIRWSKTGRPVESDPVISSS